MKLFIITGLLLLSVTRGCVDDSEEDWETETNTVGYDAADVAVRSAITDWDQFLAESYSAVDDACIKISRATDKADDPGIKHQGKLKSAIIKAESRMDKLSDMLLKAKKIQEHNYHFNESTLAEIDLFKKEFKIHREKSDKALADMEQLYREQ